MGAVGNDRLPDESETFDVPDAKAPSPEVLAQLAEAGLSDTGIEAIAGAGTARRLRRAQARESSRALPRARRARLVRGAVVAATVAALAGLVVGLLLGSITVAIAAAGLLIWAVLMGYRGDLDLTRKEFEEPVPKDVPRDDRQ